ncbi:MAG: membrane-bound PQQ-dependent dehydrogenase, glucose/quinate/shikimate family [Paracoccaceae bacterium]
MYRLIISGLLLIFGALLTVGGVYLVILDGSPAYVVMGCAIVLSAILLLNDRAAGLSVYAATLIGVLLWSLWEVGFDWWALSARGSVLVAFGILLVPVGLKMRRRPIAARNPPLFLLIASVLISAGVAVVAMFTPFHDLSGAFPADRMAAKGDAMTDGVPAGEWSSYGRTPKGQRYSPLDQITPANIATLRQAWSYQTGQVRSDKDPGETTYEVTPLIVDDTMYICTPFSTVIALDPVTGAEKWRFDPELKQPPRNSTQHMTCRGVTYFDGTGLSPQTTAANTAPGNSAARVAASAAEVTTAAASVPQNVVTGNAVADAANPVVNREAPGAFNPDPDCVKRLFVPTSDGRLITISAANGNICPGFGGDDGTINLWANMPNVTPGSAYSTSPPVVTPRLVIVGGTVNDNDSVTSPSGVIRAFDVFTGALVWNFDSKNPNATAPIAEGQTYSENAPNSWSVSSYDSKLNLIYVPMGNESPDQYGASRSADVERFSSSITALDADTGKVAWVFQGVHHDLWDMDVPAQPSLLDLTINGATVPALVAPTKQGEVFVLNRQNGQPILPVTEVPAPQGAVADDFTAPTQPISAVSFNPPTLRESDMWGATPLDQLLCRIAFRSLRYEGRYTPPSLRGSIIYPGNFGTFNWGAVAVDPERQIMFAMPVYLAFTSQLIPRPDDVTRVVTTDADPTFNENFGARYAAKMRTFLSQLGLPCQAPPWGYVAGVDLTTGKTVYQHVNGTVHDLSPLPLPFKMGVPGIGGPIITRGGVAFLSGTLDYYVRGYDLSSGAEIWSARLPAGGQATPSTYLGKDGRQYLVVVAGGHGSTGTKAGDSIIAYALPH